MVERFGRFWRLGDGERHRRGLEIAPVFDKREEQATSDRTSAIEKEKRVLREAIVAKSKEGN